MYSILYKILIEQYLEGKVDNLMVEVEQQLDALVGSNECMLSV